MTDEQGYYVAPSLPWRERLLYRLFPMRYCELPEAPATHQDCVVTTVVVGLPFVDRLRVLLTGRLVVQTKTVTEHRVGETVSASVAYPSWG